MLRKLLVATIAICFIFAISGNAFAAKDANQIKRAFQELNTNPNAKTISQAQNAVPDMPPTGLKFPYDATEVAPGTPAPAAHKAPICDWYDYSCGLAYYWTIPDAYGDDLFNMRFTAEGICDLQTLELSFYAPASAGASGVDVLVWGDDGFGFPGAVVATINVPDASMMYNPDWVSLDVSGMGIQFTDEDYHVGYTVVDQINDVYAILSDDGSCGVQRSSEYWGVWGTMLNDWGVDVNFLIAVEACCDVPVPTTCVVQDYSCGLAYYWTIPDAYGDDFFNQRFTAGDDGCQFTISCLTFYAPNSAGASGIDVYVWDDDGLGYPNAVQSSQHVDDVDMVYNPDAVCVDFTSANLFFNTEEFHVGYSTTDQVNDVYAILSDDGSCGTMRSSENWSGLWGFMADDWGVDVNFLIDAELCCPENPDDCHNTNYAGNAFYFWEIPDAFNDDFFNMRFTDTPFCTLKALNLSFYQAASVGNPGAEVYLWNSDGTFPSTVINTFPINPVTVWYPGFEMVDVSMLNIVPLGDFHVGYTPIYNDPSDVLAILSDDGSAGTMRSSEDYNGGWGTMLSDWGVDVNFLINVDVCCPPPGFCGIICDVNDQWPTYAHDYARTSQSGLFLGDLCGIANAWIYDAGDASGTINFADPIIVDDVVYASFSDGLHAINLLTGLPIWTTATHGDYAFLPSFGSYRCAPTVENGLVYFSTGTDNGFVCADAATGALQWYRGGSGVPLPGAGETRFGHSVINGNEIYFGDQNGNLFALDKTSGADLYTTTFFDGFIWTSPAAADALEPDSSTTFMLFVGTAFSTSGDGGSLYGVIPTGAAFTTDWTYQGPLAGVEGWSSSPSFRCNNLFAVSSFPYGSFNDWGGIRYNLDPATGAEIWTSYFVGGAAWYAPPASNGESVYFANIITTSAGNAFGMGLRAVNFANSTLWMFSVKDDAFGATQSATVTCDPYVFFSTYQFDPFVGAGKWYCLDGNTGAVEFSYSFSGVGLGTALAHGSDGDDYIVVFIRSGPGGGGTVYSFKDMGPRPRMIIPEHIVTLAPTDVNEAAPVQRTDPDALLNNGCVTLNFTVTLSDGLPALAPKVSDIDPQLINSAVVTANSLVDISLNDFVSRKLSSDKFYANAYEMIGDDQIQLTLPVKPAKANSASLGIPNFVSWINPASGTEVAVGAVAGGAGVDFTFEFDRNNMTLLADHVFYVEVGSDDPDYLIEETPQPAVQDIIEYHIGYDYCAFTTGFMTFGIDGSEWYNNRAKFGDGDIALDFTLDGSEDGLYEGTMFFMTSMDDAAWNVFGGDAETYLHGYYDSGTDCGGCDFGTVLPVEYTTDGGANYNNTVGDLCTFAVIDSLQGLLSVHQAGPSIGIWVRYREVGTYGADFANFKLVVFDLENRNAAPITGLYYGNFTDWDNAGGNNVIDGDVVKGFVYSYAPGNGLFHGHIGLPLSGSYWPDGSKTDPMYNARSHDNASVIYPSAPCAECELDSLYAWTDEVAEDVLMYGVNASPADPASDKAYQFALGKVDLAGNEVVSFGMALYGFLASTDYNADSENLSKFVNKYAGFHRGDLDNDDEITLVDLVRLSEYVAGTGDGPEPFKHLGDVNNDGVIDDLDCAYLAAYFFNGGPPPQSAFMF